VHYAPGGAFEKALDFVNSLSFVNLPKPVGGSRRKLAISSAPGLKTTKLIKNIVVDTFIK